jgi:hypothetical protein
MYYIKPINSDLSNKWMWHRALTYCLGWYSKEYNHADLEGEKFMVTKKVAPQAWDACPVYIVKNGKLKKTQDMAFTADGETFLRFI